MNTIVSIFSDNFLKHKIINYNYVQLKFLYNFIKRFKILYFTYIS